MSNASVPINFATFFGPVPRRPRGPGVPRPSPINAVNVATALLTRHLRDALRRLDDELPYDLSVAPVDACRLVSITPTGRIEIRLISDLVSVPRWSLTAITAHAIQFRAHRVAPREEDILFTHDQSDRRRITQIPNTVRSWIDGGHYLGLYEGLNAWDCVKLVAHYRKMLGHVPHHEAVAPYLGRATRLIIQTRLRAAQAAE